MERMHMYNKCFQLVTRTELEIKYFVVTAGINCLASFTSCTRLVDGTGVMYAVCTAVSRVHVTSVQSQILFKHVCHELDLVAFLTSAFAFRGSFVVLHFHTS